MLKLSTGLNRRSYLLAGIAGALFIYLLLIRPLLSGGSGDKLLNARRQKYVKELTLLKNREKLEAAYAPFRTELAATKGVSPEQTNAYLLKELEALFLTAGLRIVDVKVLPVSEEEGISEYLIQLESEGTLEQLLSFLYRVASGQELIAIEHLAVERNDIGSDLLTIRAVLGRFKV